LALGVTGYAWLNNEIYLEGGAYWSPSANVLSSLGADPTAPGSIAGAAPYGRIAYQHNVGPGTFEVGAMVLEAEIHPGLDNTTGLTDRYTDVGVDSSYLVAMPSTDVVTVNFRYIHENQSLKATCALAGVFDGCASNGLDDVHIDGSYYWRNKIGLTLEGFSTTGKANETIYAGNRTLTPDSAGVMVQLDATPWGAGNGPLGKRFNTRVGLQYTAYTRFDGAGSNFDGAGTNASDNNTFRVFVWAAY
jgi:hypothetical protein